MIMSKSLTSLLEKMPGAIVENLQDIVIENIQEDSRLVTKGDLFVCRVGSTVDGHDYIQAAIEKGAVAILLTKDVDVPDNVVKISVEDMHKTLESVVPFFYDYPGKKMRMIGVTGTNGKTTITYLLRDIFRRAGYKVGLIGTIKIMIEEKILPIHNTTPDVVFLQQILAKMQAAGMDYVIMEVSSHALALNRVAGCEFDTAVFTNLTRDHLDFHKTFANYALSKAKLFDSLSGKDLVKDHKNAIINVDDASSKMMMEHSNCHIFTYGIENKADLQARFIDLHSDGMSFAITGTIFNMKLDLKITGIFNVYNVMGAVGAATAEGITGDIIKQSIEAFHSVPGRFELIRGGQDFAVVVDYAHTPDGLENILRTARSISDKRIITVFGCGGNRDRTKRPIMGRIAAEMSDIIIATSDNPRKEDPTFILSEIEEGIITAIGKKKYEKIVDRKTAINEAIRLAEKDDIVIIAGKGHENYQILPEGTIHFDDKEVALEAIKKRLDGQQ